MHVGVSTYLSCPCQQGPTPPPDPVAQLATTWQEWNEDHDLQAELQDRCERHWQANQASGSQASSSKASSSSKGSGKGRGQGMKKRARGTKHRAGTHLYKVVAGPGTGS